MAAGVLSPDAVSVRCEIIFLSVCDVVCPCATVLVCGLSCEEYFLFFFIGWKIFLIQFFSWAGLHALLHLPIPLFKNKIRANANVRAMRWQIILL